MNDDRSPVLTDRLIRSALTQEPAAGFADVLGRRLNLALATAPQRRRSRVVWPWAAGLPGVDAFGSRHRRQRVGLVVALGLLLAVAIGVIALVGSMNRVPAPFGLAKAGLIAFDSGGDIFVSNADGTGLRQLTSGSATDFQPIWSPDGTKMVYRSEIDPAPEGIGGPIQEELVVMDPDGTHRLVIAKKPGGGSNFDDPAHYGSGLQWSPDSRQLVYTSPIDGIGQIFVTSADGTGSRMIGDHTLDGQDPMWSPDGKRIAFRGGSSDSDRGIYVMNADGSDVHRLMGLPDAKWPMTWSPDGGSIALVARTLDYRTQVVVVGLDDGVARPLSTGTEFVDLPVWSPDGQWLAYLTNPSAYLPSAQFAIIRPDGSGKTVFAPLVASGPAWSPDGRSLVGTAYDDATTGYQDSLIMIDIANGTSTTLPPQEATDANGNVVKGTSNWQRLAN